MLHAIESLADFAQECRQIAHINLGEREALIALNLFYFGPNLISQVREPDRSNEVGYNTDLRPAQISLMKPLGYKRPTYNVRSDFAAPGKRHVERGRCLIRFKKDLIVEVTVR